jgi:hypothetical protein
VVLQADGSYKIDNSEKSGEKTEYIDSVTASEDVQEIYVHVKENIDYLLRADESFQEFYDMINEK